MGGRMGPWHLLTVMTFEYVAGGPQGNEPQNATEIVLPLRLQIA